MPLLADFASNLFELPPPFNMVVLIVAIIFSYALLTAIASEIRRFASHREEQAFKRELVDRGYSSGEIEQIVNSGGGYNKEEDSAS